VATADPRVLALMPAEDVCEEFREKASLTLAAAEAERLQDAILGLEAHTRVHAAIASITRAASFHEAG
jgi:hypothetical protein